MGRGRSPPCSAAAQVSKRRRRRHRLQHRSYSILIVYVSVCLCVCASLYLCPSPKWKLGIVSFSFRNERKCCLMCFLLFTSAGVPHPQKRTRHSHKTEAHQLFSLASSFPRLLCLSPSLSLCSSLIILWHSSGCDAFISMQIFNAAG